MMAKPMKTLELHYPMIQFSIKADKPLGILVEHEKNLYIRHSIDLRLGAHSVGRALKRVNPKQHRERQTSITLHLNPMLYFAEYFGNKLHLDQNEKLVRYGVT